MLASGVMERVTAIERLYQREEASHPPVHNVSWRGFLVSILEDPKSIMFLSGGAIAGIIGTWIGIRERTPEVYIPLPIITALAEGLYLGVKWCLYTKKTSHEENEDIESIADMVPLGAIELDSTDSDCLMNEQASCSKGNGQAVLSESAVSDMDFLKAFEYEYFASDGADFDARVAIFKELKHRFPNYFSNHKKREGQLLLEDKTQCRIMVEGIFKCYRHQLNIQDQYRVLETFDQGDCMYDAFWQGIPSGKREQLLNEFSEELSTLEAQVGEGGDPYLVLKVLLNKAADKEQYRDFILKNGKSQGPDAYNTIDEYRRKMMDKSIFWGRHGIEGWILAKELDCNLVLIPGCDYIPELGFVDRDAQVIFASKTAETTLYMDNSFLHYSAAEKKREDSRSGVSRD